MRETGAYEANIRLPGFLERVKKGRHCWGEYRGDRLLTRLSGQRGRFGRKCGEESWVKKLADQRRRSPAIRAP